LFVNANYNLYQYEYTSSWDAGTIIATHVYSFWCSVTKLSDSNIWAVYSYYETTRGTYGIPATVQYNGTWQSQKTVSGINLTGYPLSITHAKDKLILFYIGGETYPTNYDIYMSIFNESDWGTPIQLTDDDNYTRLLSCENSNHYDTYMYFAPSWDWIYVEKVFPFSVSKTLLSDTKVKGINIQESLLSNALVIVPERRYIQSDTNIKIAGIQNTILSDARIVLRSLLVSNTKIFVAGNQKTILSNSKIVIEILYNINQKINSALEVLSNINNKINTSIREILDINNFINTCKRTLSDISNDIRTHGSTLKNINNDFRYIAAWQIAGSAGTQSLGKTYIRVYFNSIEQTDIDVDSINISKNLSSAHTATFDLGRAYDSTKPTMEAAVQIKYNNWILFSGYITSISPAEDPEKIRINCQDEYWKQNKSNVYYHVGHKPTDDKELYYETISEALSAQHGVSFGIGNFTPQVLDNFAVGKSDAISNLIRESGNYEWFYDVDGTKKLWSAGEGSSIELERQTLGQNIHLYNVINHSFDESVDNLVNKYRVQMGDKVTRKFNDTGGTRTYTGYHYSAFESFLHPAWDSSYEVLSRNSYDGYGWDYPDPDDATEYAAVFKKYEIPYLDSELSSWSDRYPPYIEVYGPSGFIYGYPIGRITDGFTIDYENKLVIFSEPTYIFYWNSAGEPAGIRTPALKLHIFKKNYYTYTLNPSDNPETDISNPMMFFTDKMGDYADTIIKDLNLSTLSIQEGGTFIDNEGNEILVPSWDDTAFALDYANWQLSKTCDKEIRGTITITLDTLCFYNIDLSKRIYINGITEDTMNITAINYNLSNFTVSVTLENSRHYNRSQSLQSHGE